ncbi:helix-turn-helix domain-containing protein [Actinomycetospora sp. NBRC 106378]|uniref:PucR family transcriptional regulator n=1 Tax=Actinomycetospora sp. NBRC 106378 TaxID=3032208 RepID=UPI0024A12060|nr:helix-turn-helix domain-containing protein [Actinomycetospora sp. NBRC 106378]GLZ54295.1 Fis family transcriptional regulator [Actinomycetospora sp. NBRC 106378]
MTVLPDTSRAALVDAVVARMPRLVAEVRDELTERVPDYARFLTEHLESVTRSAGAVAGRIVALMGEPAPGDEVELDFFEDLGRSQWRDGRALPDLLAAYQIGGRALWRHVSAAALVIGLRSEDLAGLAEAVFFFVDQLSSASAHGYVLEQEEAGVLRDRHREALVELLLAEPADPIAVRAAARRAEWPVPERLSVVLVEPDHARALSRLDAQALPVRRPSLVGALVPHRSPGGGERAVLRRLLHGAHATIGAPVPLEKVARSLALTEIAARLTEEHLLSDDPLFVADHLDAIIVHRDQQLLDALGDQVLAPLEACPPGARDRLRETLRSWLRHMGDRRAVAEELHVHPQTVRYRMNQLHQIYGDALEDPAQRARMQLALGW